MSTAKKVLCGSAARYAGDFVKDLGALISNTIVIYHYHDVDRTWQDQVKSASLITMIHFISSNVLAGFATGYFVPALCDPRESDEVEDMGSRIVNLEQENKDLKTHLAHLYEHLNITMPVIGSSETATAPDEL